MDAVLAGGVSLTGEGRWCRFGEAGPILVWTGFFHYFTSLKGKAKFLGRRGSAACSLVGQLFPFSVIGAIFMLVPGALTH